MASALRIDATRAEQAPDEEDDTALVLRAQAERRAFAPLYRRYVDSVYRYCYRRLGSREAAEDATSVVFARALSALAGCRPESFRSWLFAIAHNAVANDLRGARHDRTLEEAAPMADAEPGPEAAALAKEARASVLGLLPLLPIEQRRVLELRLAGLSGPEIAAVLGRSHGGVRVAQYRAIARLRTLLGVEVGKGDDGNG